MRFNFYVLLFLLIYYGCSDVHSVVMKCPTYQLYFQKILGFRPAQNVISTKNILYSGNAKSPIGLECWKQCTRDPDCYSYVIIIDKFQCYGYSLLEGSKHFEVLPPNAELFEDSNAIYFEKVCLNVPENCKTKLWAITKIPGSSLVSQGKKTLPKLVSRRECAEACMFETEFNCLSASFTASHKNNYARFGIVSEDAVGQCILSEKDKLSQPDAFRVSTSDEEYIENNCFMRRIEKESCSYELYANSTFIYSELSYNGLSQKECQQNCSRENRFYCQGVTYEEEVNSSKCYLHSDDLISMGPRSLETKVNSIYMRRVKCLDVSVVCTNDEMIINFTPNGWFNGKLYVSSHSEECSVAGNGINITTLKLPIGNEIKENRCGVLRAYELNGSIQRTFISALLVIQHNRNVQTQGDRVIKVGCIINNASYTDGVPDNIALGSSLAFSQTELPSSGSIALNTSAQIPKIIMKIIDLDRNSETNDVQIGQNLELQIIVDPPDSTYDIQVISLIARSDKQGNYYNLIDKNGCPVDKEVFPALEKVVTKDMKMLRGKFHAFKFPDSSLVSFDVMIMFCMIECPQINCKNDFSQGKRRKRFTDDYALNGIDTESVQVTKPSSDYQITGQQFYSYSNQDLNNAYDNALYIPFTTSVDNATNGVNVKEISRNKFVDSKRILRRQLELPLNYQIHVRGPYLGESESLIYGENSKILVAGFDPTRSSSVCINVSLLIALLIFWIIFQIVVMVGCCYLIRKYKRLAAIDEDRSSLHKIHESLDYADGNRRVRWADQGFTFA